MATQELEDHLMAVKLQEEERLKAMHDLKVDRHPTLRTGRSGHMAMNSAGIHNHDDQIGERNKLSTGRSGHKALQSVKKPKKHVDIDFDAIEKQAFEDAKEQLHVEVHPTLRTGRSGQMAMNSAGIHNHDNQIGERTPLSTGRSGHKALQSVKKPKKHVDIDFDAIEAEAVVDAFDLEHVEVHPTLRTGRSGQAGMNSAGVHNHDREIGERNNKLSTGRSGHGGLTPVIKK